MFFSCFSILYYYYNSLLLINENIIILILLLLLLTESLLFVELPPGFPVITEGPGSHKSIEVGHNAVLQCTASGNPVPTIYWLRENMRLDLDTNPRYSILDKGFPGMYS